LAILVMPEEGGLFPLYLFNIFHPIPVSERLQKVIYEEISGKLESKLKKITPSFIKKTAEHLRITPPVLRKSKNRKLSLDLVIWDIDPEMRTVKVRISFPFTPDTLSPSRDYSREIVRYTQIVTKIGFMMEGDSSITYVASISKENPPVAVPIPGREDLQSNTSFYYVTEEELEIDPGGVKKVAQKISESF